MVSESNTRVKPSHTMKLFVLGLASSCLFVANQSSVSSANPAPKPIVTLATTAHVVNDSITLTGTVDNQGVSGTTYSFSYGFYGIYCNNKAQFPNPPTYLPALVGPQTVSATFSNLEPDGDYCAILRASNTNGATSSNDFSFTDPGLLPTMSPLSVTNITPTSATFSDTINPEVTSLSLGAGSVLAGYQFYYT